MCLLFAVPVTLRVDLGCNTSSIGGLHPAAKAYAVVVLQGALNKCIH